MMQSAIYQGELRHRRFYPKPHKFNYTSTMFFIDLDELAAATHAAGFVGGREVEFGAKVGELFVDG